MGDQPKLNYTRDKISTNPFRLRSSVVKLQQEVDMLKKTLLSDIVHLHIGEVLDVQQEGVSDSSEIPTDANSINRKISLKSTFYKVHRFDGTIFEKVFFNGSLSMEDPPVIGSLILFLNIGHDYYVVKTLTTNRRKNPVGIVDTTTSTEFNDIDRNLEPGQVRISDAQDGASIFFGNGNIRLSCPSQTTFINLVNETGTINTLAANKISSIDELYNLTVTDIDSSLILEKETDSTDFNASISIDALSQIALENFYGSLQIELNKLELIRGITPATSLTMDNTGKLILRSNVEIDPVTNSPIPNTELSNMILDGNNISLSNLKFKLNFTNDLILIGNDTSNLNVDLFNNLEIKAPIINLNGKINFTDDAPELISDHPLKLTAPLLTLNGGVQRVARVGDTVSGEIVGTVDTGPGAGGVVSGTFTGTITGPGNESVLA